MDIPTASRLTSHTTCVGVPDCRSGHEVVVEELRRIRVSKLAGIASTGWSTMPAELSWPAIRTARFTSAERLTVPRSSATMWGPST